MVEDRASRAGGVDRRVVLGAGLGAAVAAMPAPITVADAANGADGAATATTTRLTRTSPALWRVRIDNPPFNLVVPAMVRELHALVAAIEADRDVKVVVVESAIPGYFIDHFDLAQAAAFPVMPDDPSTAMWSDMVVRLAKAPVVTIASVRGRTRGGGNEFSMACDLRYASREHAAFGQPEVGAGILPGGGASERMPRLVGRDRALEVILSSGDYDADAAERYGLVTRTMPDADLDAFVDGMAHRLSGFDKQALAAAKAQVDRASLPPDGDIRRAYGEYAASLSWPGFAARRPRMRKLVAEHGADVEARLGHYLGVVND